MKTTIKFTYLLILVIIAGSCSKKDDTPPFNLDALQGKWYRIGGNNPGANGMEITVTHDQGVITNQANTSLPLNGTKWKDITATRENSYEHGELGSDGNYYNGFMELGVDDTLRIWVNHIGAGNEQKWVRNFIAPIAELNECEPYEPETFTMAKKEDWLEAGEEDHFPALLPASTDPAGGYYVVTLEGDPLRLVKPWLEIKASGEDHVIINGTSAGSDAPFTRKVAFSAHPGISYDVMARAYVDDINASLPANYEIKWEYHGIMDCYEPNNNFDQAKFIPKNEAIEAFANKNNEGYGVQEEEEDYFKIVLFQPAKLKAELLQSPSDDFINLNFYRDGGAEITTDLTPVAGNPTNRENGSLYQKISRNTLDAGIYYVRATTFMNGGKKADLNNGDPLPDSWTTPYRFIVTAEE